MKLKLHRNKPATKIDMEALQKHVEDYPDSYQHEHAARFGVSSSCILYALRRLGISNKKTLFHPKADAAKRAEFAAKLHQNEQVEHRPIIYMDERILRGCPKRSRIQFQREEMLWHQGLAP